MMFLFVLVALSFSFTATITEMGFADYIVDNTKDIMLPSLMPFILFVVFGITEFMTGTNWDLYMITLPAVIPLSQAIGADPYLCIAAIISAGVWEAIYGCLRCYICTSAAATTMSTLLRKCLLAYRSYIDSYCIFNSRIYYLVTKIYSVNFSAKKRNCRNQKSILLRII